VFEGLPNATSNFQHQTRDATNRGDGMLSRLLDAVDGLRLLRAARPQSRRQQDQQEMRRRSMSHFGGKT
jgi:hypothetical protein